MEPAEGYQALQIENREVDDEMILLQYDMAVEENPGSVEYYTKALAAIASGRKSDVLLNHLHSKAPQAPEGTQDEPVGLENIGNTCYLNSLLQALFTLITFRHVVLDFDEYKMSLEPKNMESKRVGQRKVSLKEVQTAQKCTCLNRHSGLPANHSSCRTTWVSFSWHDRNTTVLHQTRTRASTADPRDGKC